MSAESIKCPTADLPGMVIFGPGQCFYQSPECDVWRKQLLSGLQLHSRAGAASHVVPCTDIRSRRKHVSSKPDPTILFVQQFMEKINYVNFNNEKPKVLNTPQVYLYLLLLIKQKKTVQIYSQNKLLTSPRQIPNHSAIRILLHRYFKNLNVSPKMYDKGNRLWYMNRIYNPSITRWSTVYRITFYVDHR